MGISPDSESYLVTANRFTQERWGESLNLYWPPLYPLSIAAIKAVGLVGLLGAARIVSVLSFIVSIIAVFLLGMELKEKYVAHLCTISCLFLAPMVYLFCFFWSETLYIMLSLLFFVALTRLIKATGGEETRYLILSGILAGLGTITRFVGCSLIGTGVISLLLLSNYSSGIAKLKKALIFVLVSGVPVFLYLLSCFFYIGLATKKQFPSSYSFSHQLLQLPLTFYRDFLTFKLMYWKYTFIFDWSFPFFWLGVFVLIGLVVYLFLFLKTVFRTQPEKSFAKFLKASIIYPALYLTIILFTSSTITVDPIGSRFTVPVYPFVLLMIFSVVFLVLRTSNLGKSRNWLRGVAILSLGIFWSTQLVSTISIYKNITAGLFPSLEQPGNLNRESIRFLKQIAGPNDNIVSNVYRKLTFIWPRQEPYLYVNAVDWEKSIDAIMLKASQQTIYFLIFTGDSTPQKITVEDLDKADKQMGLFAWKKSFGNDCLYKIRQVTLQPLPDSKEGE